MVTPYEMRGKYLFTKSVPRRGAMSLDVCFLHGVITFKIQRIDIVIEKHPQEEHKSRWGDIIMSPPFVGHRLCLCLGRKQSSAL